MAVRHVSFIALALVAALAACSSNPETESSSVTTVNDTVSSETDQPAVDPESDKDSQTLQIDLQGGFEGSAVEVLIDGTEVFSSESVKTVAMTGFAESFTVQVASDAVEIELRVAGESVSVDRVALGDGLFVGLSIGDGAAAVIQTDDAFGYG